MNIMPMNEGHRDDVLAMMQVFYASPAVFTNGSREIFEADVDNCISDNPYIEGYVFDCEGETAGYGMLAKSFSTEFGKACIWIEDIYLKENFRDKGFGSEFINYVAAKYPDAILRLEVEEENARAVHVYEKNGFTVLPYMEMKR